ncbi:peptidoglycan-recognition protein LC-like isoform X1 [Battus philenor]|uniref:peptidoglycan-recognition protein LC-like isoform X1 n=1 Tax=Battus philenor TaxID=42288 RepID=UPI0035D03902
MQSCKMAMKNDEKNNAGIKIEGDLGDLQIIEEMSDDDCTCNDKQTLPRPNSLGPKIPLSPVAQVSTVPVFGSVSVSNSENVQFGNNTYFNGPVTIIQSKSGLDNAAYSRTEDDNIQNEEYQTKPKIETQKKKHEILIWHKITFSALCVVVVGGICAIILVLRTKTEEHNSFYPTFSPTDASVNKMVVVLNYDIFTIIILSSIVLPIIMLLIYSYHSLLTKTASVIGGEINYNNEKIKVTTSSMRIYNIDKVDPLLIAPNHLRIVSRTDWLAQPEAGVLDKLVQPVPWVVISHTATESCHTQSQCVLRVRLIQSFHIESRGWYDIGYNFLIGGDGSVYYGRGWDYMGAHTKGYNKYSIGIAFIGTFNIDSPSKQQVDACKKIIQQGVAIGKLVKDYKLFAHSQLMSTLSPGDKVYEIIKTWPHFVHNISDINSLVPQGY